MSGDRVMRLKSPPTCRPAAGRITQGLVSLTAIAIGSWVTTATANTAMTNDPMTNNAVFTR
jgi:hypothetical protein